MMDRNPQREQMSDESMVRTLAAQANAIWPQEEPLLERYGLAGPISILDVGCGSGEITNRLAQRYPQARILAIDVLKESVALARRRYPLLAPRVEFRQGDAFALECPAGSIDLTVCRHVTQSVPHVEELIGELARVTRPGGWLHVLSEDYAMLQMPVRPLDTDRLWHQGAIAFAELSDSDARVGRRTYTLLHRAGLRDIHVDYATVDTLRVARETIEQILVAWRDGYTEPMSRPGRLKPEEVAGLFNQMIRDVRDPEQYLVWHVPIISGRKPG